MKNLNTLIKEKNMPRLKFSIVSNCVITKQVTSAFYKSLSKPSNKRCKLFQDALENIFNVDAIPCIILSTPMPQKTAYIMRSIEFIYKAIKNIISADIVLCQGYPDLISTMTCTLFKNVRRFILVIKDTHWYWPETRISRYLWPLYLRLIKRADLIIVPGKASYVFWLKNGLRNVAIVHYYWLESCMEPCTEMPRNLEKLRELGCRWVVLYLGRLIKKRGLDYLVNAFSRIITKLPDACLVIAGTGPEEITLKNLVKNLQLESRVIFLGPVGEGEKECIYKKADVFVYVPIKTTIPEEWPIPPLEALKVGVIPIISNVVGSIPELKGYAKIVPERDIESLANAIVSVLTDIDSYKSMRPEFIRYAKSIDHFTVLREFLKALKIVLRLV